MDLSRKVKFWGLVLVLASWGAASVSRAELTTVLPKHRAGVELGYRGLQITRWFDSFGRDRDLGYYLNHVNVTSFAKPEFNNILNQVITASGLPLPPVDPLTYDSTKRAETFLKARVDVQLLTFAAEYGVTDKLTIGAGFPYFLQAHTEVEFRALLWPSAGFFSDPLYGLLWQATFGPKLLPSGALDLTRQAQQFIRHLGYHPIRDWNGPPGIGDVKIGAKYRFLNLDKIKSAAGLWGTLPTGRPDDERNLTDLPYGLDHYTTGAAAMVDVLPVKPLTMNFTGRYVYNWPVNRGVFMLDRRDPLFSKAELPTLHQFGSYRRGDYYELETELYLQLARGVLAFSGYTYKQTQHDTLDGHVIPITNLFARTLRGGFIVDTTDGFFDLKPKVPFILSFYLEEPLTGQNTEKTRSAIANLSVFF